MYFNKRELDYLKDLVFKDYCTCHNTRVNAENEGNYDRANDLLYHELYLLELLSTKFKMGKTDIYNLQRKIYLDKTY